MKMAILCQMKRTEIHLLYTRSIPLKAESKAGRRSLERAYPSLFAINVLWKANTDFLFNSVPLGTRYSFWRLSGLTYPHRYLFTWNVFEGMFLLYFVQNAFSQHLASDHYNHVVLTDQNPIAVRYT